MAEQPPTTTLGVLSGAHHFRIVGHLEQAPLATPNENSEPSFRPICWLYGSFGCGKSAIAQKIAEGYSRRGQLAASFLFFRNAGSRSGMGSFATTLAHQISLNLPEARMMIEHTIAEDPGMAEPTRSLESQLQNLVFGPLLACLTGSDARSDDPYLVVVDGLDKCMDKDGMAAFIDFSIQFFREYRIPLRLLVTSRVEEHIRGRVNDGLEVAHLVDLSSWTSRADIERFMRLFFASAQRQDRALQALGELWPGQPDLDRLVEYRDGSFIFGSTVATFIIKGPGETDARTPPQRLALALEINRGIDGVYAEILSRASHVPHFLAVLSTVACAQTSLSISTTSALLDLSTYDILRVLVLLQATIQVPGRDDIPVTVFRTSLPDSYWTKVGRETSTRLHLTILT
ncbi:hypothetical protein FA13DRAFT_1813192 [Coprinellus micaceus]|uniref:Nephrocystin 3-like N-terminal domain-containing protein n=1 Tax=Coprinellus micaceus TaxID=71717 RepID=A0A4Y7TFA4_COPMI|nr:hypothetical protein FA13DRAFT_1813192 [Coprinellus micaceus]